MTKDKKQETPKLKIILAGVLVVGVICYGAFEVYSAFSKAPSRLPSQEAVIDSKQPAELPQHYQTEPVVQIAHIPIEDAAPTIKQAEFAPSDKVKRLLDYSNRANQSKLKSTALKAEKDAEVASKEYEHAKASPVLSLTKQLNTGDGLPSHVNEAKQPQKVTFIEDVNVKSLVKAGGVITGWISVGNELVPIKKGSVIGNFKVVNITPDSVTFTNGATTKTRWLGGTVTPKPEAKEERRR